jgi:hypothetical protein
VFFVGWRVFRGFVHGKGDWDPPDLEKEQAGQEQV